MVVILAGRVGEQSRLRSNPLGARFECNRWGTTAWLIFSLNRLYFIVLRVPQVDHFGFAEIRQLDAG